MGLRDVGGLLAISVTYRSTNRKITCRHPQWKYANVTSSVTGIKWNVIPHRLVIIGGNKPFIKNVFALQSDLLNKFICQKLKESTYFTFYWGTIKLQENTSITVQNKIKVIPMMEKLSLL